MANNSEISTSNQGDFFQRLSDHEPAYLADNAPDLNIKDELRVAMKYCLRQSRKHGLSRDHIVERMNLCLPGLNKPITLRMLDGWMATSAEDRPMPAEYLPAFIWATRGIVSPIEVLTEVLGLHLIDEAEQIAAELGKTLVDERRAKNRRRLLQIKLGG